MRVSTVKKAGVTRISGTTKPAVSSTRVQQVHIHRCLYTQCNQQCKSMCSGELVVFLQLMYSFHATTAHRVCVP